MGELGDKIQSGIEGGVRKGTEVIKGTAESVIKGLLDRSKPTEQPKPLGESNDYRKKPLIYYTYLVWANEVQIDRANEVLSAYKAELRRAEEIFDRTKEERKSIVNEMKDVQEAKGDYDPNDEHYKHLEQLYKKLDKKVPQPDALKIESDVLGDNAKYDIGLFRKKLEYRIEQAEEALDEYTRQRNLAENWYKYYESQRLKVIKEEND
ncbi:hypothetical protein HYW82_00630 [Candidatus Peregrinibacteria bacterium]|nr:hypothetical protein [Candidatus Peregrinibacteria bacterium]